MLVHLLFHNENSKSHGSNSMPLKHGDDNLKFILRIRERKKWDFTDSEVGIAAGVFLNFNTKLSLRWKLCLDSAPFWSL